MSTEVTVLEKDDYTLVVTDRSRAATEEENERYSREQGIYGYTFTVYETTYQRIPKTK